MRKLRAALVLFVTGVVTSLQLMTGAPALADAGGWVNPNSNGGLSGTVTNPQNAYTSDNSRAEYSANEANWYGFPSFAIPATATIDAIQVRVEGLRIGVWDDGSFDIQLSYNGGASWTPGTPKNTGRLSSSSDQTVPLSNDTWSYSSWTPAILNSADFRVRVAAKNGSANLDHLEVQVTFTPLVAGPPTVVSAATNAQGSKVSVSFNKAMNNPSASAGQFTYRINAGVPQTFSASQPGATANVIDLTADGTTIVYGDNVTLSYTGAPNNTTSVDGEILAAFTDRPVINNGLSYVLTVHTSPSGGGNTVTKNPTDPNNRYGSNTNVDLTAVPTTGWTFSSWTGGLTGSQNPASIQMSSDKTVTATFTETPVTMTMNIVGNGYVSQNPEQVSYLPSSHTNVGLEATAPPGWVFEGWSGNLTGTANPTTILMDANKIITATFIQAPGALEVNTTGSGTVTKNPDTATYPAGTQVQVTAAPATGWTFAGWGGDLSGANPSATITMDENRVVNAVFILPASTKWWDTRFMRRAEVTINGTGTALTNYQLKVPVTWDSDMLADFGDIRFAAQDNASELSYWMSKSTASTSAEFWVKVPFVAAAGQTKVYMYYGYRHGAITTASDIHTTFIWGDDFQDTNWTNANVHPWNAEAGGQMPVQGIESGVYSMRGVVQAEPIAEIWNPTTNSLKQFQGNYVAEVEFSPQDVPNQSEDDAGGAYITGRYAGVEWKYEQLIDIQWDNADINVVDGDIWYNLAAGHVLPVERTIVPSTWYKLRATLLREGNTNRLLVHLNDVAQSDVTDSRLKFNGLAFLTFDFDSGYHVHYDNFRVREYAAAEPALAVGSEQVLTPAVVVNPVSGLVTTEAGGTATFTVVLTAHPLSDVTIGLSSTNLTEGMVSPASLTFTPADWSTPQTVTATGVDDPYDDNNIAYTIATTNATSTDPSYDIDVQDVSVINNDNDTAGLTLNPASGLVTTEAGGTATFTVVLTIPTTANVLVQLNSSDTTEGTVPPALLTFTTVNWNTPQLVTVTGVDDAMADGNIAYTIITQPAVSLDPGYSGLNAADAGVSNSDNDTAGITLTPASGLVTTEAGGTATFTMKLNTQPAANVVIGLTSSDTTEGTVAPASVTFTSTNWNTPQTVTVTGVDDNAADGNIAYTIVTAAATSTDQTYNGFNAADVSATNNDNDVPGIAVTPTSGLVTTEAGGTATFTVVLNTLPTASVLVQLTSSDTTEGTVPPALLTFTTVNWNTPQLVTVTGVDDALADGSIAYTIITQPAVSLDPGYSDLNAPDVGVSNSDNDTVGITLTPASGLVTTEAGGTATFTMKLTIPTTADVVIGLTSSDITEGTVSPASLTFTSTNWNVTQTVTVTGVDDGAADGDIAYTIVTAAATSTDQAYNGYDAADVSATNNDNDTARIAVNPTSGLVTTEAGGTATFTVVLNTLPTASVVIGVHSSDITEGTVPPLLLLTFTTVNWNTPQTVTITGVNDSDVDGNVSYTIVSDPAVSSDLSYNGVNAPDVTVNNNDNDPAGVTVNPTSGLVTTEAHGTATFTVRLNTQPSDNVTIGLSSSDTTEGTVSPASLTFTSTNWNVSQTVTVTGVDDSAADGNVVYDIITGAGVSSDVDYNGLNAPDVRATNSDNEVSAPMGGGGGGGGAPTIPLTGFAEGQQLPVNGIGYVQSTVRLTSPSGDCALEIPLGATLLTASGSPLASMSHSMRADWPQPPAGKSLIAAHELGPDGATFTTPLKLNLTYDKAKLPVGASATDLVIAWWDGTKWAPMGTTVNADGSLSTSISHFSVYAILCPAAAAAPAPTAPAPTPLPAAPPIVAPSAPPQPAQVSPAAAAAPAPASFTVSGLTASPATAGPADPVVVSVLVTNTGGTEGKYTIILKIDGAADNSREISREIHLAGGEGQTVTFTVLTDKPGQHTIDINGQVGRFEIVAPSSSPDVRTAISPPAEKASPTLITLIAAGLVVLGTAAFIMLSRARRQRSGGN